jgi:hypothetical protein
MVEASAEEHSFEEDGLMYAAIVLGAIAGIGGFWVGGPMCIVDFEQFSLFAQYWLESGPDVPADLDGSGTVDLADFEMFAYEWLFYCPYGWPLR